MARPWGCTPRLLADIFVGIFSFGDYKGRLTHLGAAVNGEDSTEGLWGARPSLRHLESSGGHMCTRPRREQVPPTVRSGYSSGGNGAETQALYENEDRAWSARLHWATLHGVELRRGEQEEVVKWVRNDLIADSKGCYDAVHNSETMGLGMQNSRSSVEVIGVRMYIGDEHNQFLLWCSSDLNLADARTKDYAEARKVLGLWFIRKTWNIKWDEDFVSVRKKRKLGRMANPAETQVDKENETEAEYEGDEVTFDVGDIVEM